VDFTPADFSLLSLFLSFSPDAKLLFCFCSAFEALYAFVALRFDDAAAADKIPQRRTVDFLCGRGR
jgi:hypothetical protein